MSRLAAERIGVADFISCENYHRKAPKDLLSLVGPEHTLLARYSTN